MRLVFGTRDGVPRLREQGRFFPGGAEDASDCMAVCFSALKSAHQRKTFTDEDKTQIGYVNCSTKER